MTERKQQIHASQYHILLPILGIYAGVDPD
jgi:hypothetical protein